MSLQWFAFKIGDYVRDTMRLNTEAHGAYLLLMLDYYATEESPPDDDDVLASITKLPVEVWAAKYRKLLAPFFEIKDGRWFHDRIEREILDGRTKHEAAVAKATKASAASVAARPPKGDKKSPPRQQQAVPQPDLKPTHLPLPKHISPSERVDAPSPKAALQDLGKEVDPEFIPDMELIERARSVGISDPDIGDEVRKFINHHLEKGSLSNNWQASFSKWIDRAIEWRAKNAPKPEKAPPRIEVNTTPDYAGWCKMWLKLRRWPRDSGGEPGMLSCLVPKSILLAHGIDPATGDKIRDHVG